MNEIKVYILVEGATEQTFVRDVLAPWIGTKGIFLYPALIGKPGHKGGDVRYSRAKEDIRNLLFGQKHAYISTMFDYFRIDTDWPGMSLIKQHVCNGTSLTVMQKAAILENATKDEIIKHYPECNAKNRFIPYIEMHEFEALLFSDVRILAKHIEVDEATINQVLQAYNNNPEEINDDPEKAPSKRLNVLKPGYRKVAMGKIVGNTIGIPTIREKCAHFNQWLAGLECLRRFGIEKSA